MAPRTRKNEQQFLKELEELESRRKKLESERKAYVKKITDEMGRIYFDLCRLEDDSISVDDALSALKKKLKTTKEDQARLKAEQKDEQKRQDGLKQNNPENHS